MLSGFFKQLFNNCKESLAAKDKEIQRLHLEHLTLLGEMEEILYKENVDEKLTTNFNESEVWEWAKNISTMSAADKEYAISLAKKEYQNNPESRRNAMYIAQRLQTIRDVLNSLYPEHKGRIGIKVTSWLRPLEWEKHRKRSGASQHVQGHAVDFIITIPKGTHKQIQNIMGEVWVMLKFWNGGLAKKGNVGDMTFIHIDLGRKRRWEY